jgi:hypothetical protein
VSQRPVNSLAIGRFEPPLLHEQLLDLLDHLRRLGHYFSGHGL